MGFGTEPANIRVMVRDNTHFLCVEGEDDHKWVKIQSLSTLLILVDQFIGFGGHMSDDPITRHDWEEVQTERRFLSPYKHALYTVEWQVLRIGLKGDWGSFEGAKANLKVLYEYIEKGATNNITRLYRVINLLNATRMGYHASNLVGTQQDELLLRVRDTAEKRMQQLRIATQGVIFEAPTEDVVRREWPLVPEGVQREIVDDLLRRLGNEAHDGSRPELRWFLRCIGVEA